MCTLKAIFIGIYAEGHVTGVTLKYELQILIQEKKMPYLFDTTSFFLAHFSLFSKNSLQNKSNYSLTT